MCVIAFNLWMVTAKQIPDAAYKYEKYYHIFVWGTSCFFTFLPFAGGVNVFGPAGAW